MKFSLDVLKGVFVIIFSPIVVVFFTILALLFVIAELGGWDVDK